MTGFFVVPHKIHMYMMHPKRTLKTHLFHNISMTYHVNLTEQGLASIQHWWFCRILLLSLNCLFLTIPLFYVRVCWAVLQGFLGAANQTAHDNFGMFGCTRRFPFFFHAIFLVFDWSSKHVFFVSPMYPPHKSCIYFLVLQLMQRWPYILNVLFLFWVL